MRRHTYDEIRTVRGYHFGVRCEPDADAGPPWENSDCHGPVSEWRRFETKCPGERVLIRDRAFARFYDAETAQRIALRDHWGHREAVPGESARERAARAVAADFEYLAGWCRDRWHYVAVIVEWTDADGQRRTPETGASLCGVEDLDGYPAQVADELIAECLSEIETATPDVVLSEN